MSTLKASIKMLLFCGASGAVCYGCYLYNHKYVKSKSVGTRGGRGVEVASALPELMEEHRGQSDAEREREFDESVFPIDKRGRGVTRK